MIPPSQIWLQLADDGEATWCQDQINDTDIEYIRADIAAEWKEKAWMYDDLCN